MPGAGSNRINEFGFYTNYYTLSKRNTLEAKIQVICGINGEQVVFDEELWSGLLDYIMVKEDGLVGVVFKGGIEIALEG